MSDPRQERSSPFDASERPFRALIEHSADGIALTDRQGIFLYVSPSTECITGFPSEALLGTHSFDLIHPEDAPSLLEQFDALLEQPATSVIVTARYQHQDGSWHWTEGTATNLLADPSVQAVVWNFRDITARKHAEANLLFHASIARSLSDAVIATDPELRILSWNAAAEALYGWRQDEVLGHLANFLHTVFPDAAAQPWETALATQGSWTGEVIQQRKDGTTLPVLASVALVRDQAGTTLGAVAVNRDITERKALEQHKDDFIRIASHELNTPMTSLKGYAELLWTRFQRAGDERAAQLLANMNEQIDHFIALLREVLDVTQLETGQMLLHRERCDLQALVQEHIEEVQRTTQTHRIVLEEQAVCWVDADPKRIGQVVTNLLTNAIKYAPAAPLIGVRLTTRSAVVTCSVQDGGPGIAPDQQTRLFKRFSRISSARGETSQGLGLGLYLVAQLVERHRGRIWVESEEGKGATFLFTLPLPSILTSGEASVKPVGGERTHMGETPSP